MPLRLLAIAFYFIGLSIAEAAPSFAHLFADHAVLQQGTEIHIWGSGANPHGKPEPRLVIRFGEIEATADVDADGNWSVVLPALPASLEGTALVLLEDGVEVAVAKDVVVGEVWLAAGQSNMQFQVKGMLKGMPEVQEWIDSADCPGIRFRRIGDPVLEDREAEAADLAAAAAWLPMDRQSVLGFSAVAAGFARELANDLKVPIGIIDVSWGGKPIEPFIPREAFSTTLLKQIKALADRDALEELAALHGGVIIRNPQGHPGAIFNARVAPLVPFAMRGFLWYQAESNAGKGEDPRKYRHKMTALIEGWRARWNDENLPCYFVQLPSFPSASGWIRVREEQRRTLAIPHSGMAVTIDIRGDDIHPADKLPVAERLARLALAQTYRQADLVANGPLYLDHTVKGGTVHVRFLHSAPGLMVGDRPGTGPARETPDAALRWFELAGADGTWHSAAARIEGEQVIVSSDAVAAPVAVRYACETRPQGGNLYNRAGLPASPFCSRLDWLPWVDAR